MVGRWLLWPETKAALQYGLKWRDLTREYAKFAEQHGYPGHKAIRKTIAQWIQDNVGEEEARLYRCEKVAGTHGKYYVTMSEAQVTKLDDALTKVHAVLFT